MIALEDTPRTLRPLPKRLWGHACSCCDKPWSRWASGPRDLTTFEAICSICFLYRSEWGRSNKEKIAWAVEVAQKEKPVALDDNLRLVSPQDGDRILAAFATQARMNVLEGRTGGSN